MTSTQIETNIKELIHSFSKDTFIYDLLLAYGQPKATINRLKQGTANLSKDENTILLKKKLYYKLVEDADLHHTIDDLSKDSSIHAHNPRFIIVTDNQTILSVDTKTEETLDIEIERLDKHYDFFLPWAGMEKSQHQNENPADVKAAEKMALLFDNINRDNPADEYGAMIPIKEFMVELLFCYYAEDTNMFKDGIFTNGIISHTQEDGSDLSKYLFRLFYVLATDYEDRVGLPAHLNAFPYVGGALFARRYATPVFTKTTRKIIIECGQLDWAAINPDIFGSMMQGIVTNEDRGSIGMHYTSVPNIMKVIEPLFLNNLYEEFDKAKGNQTKLNSLLVRLSKIKIFDPACGSGNFLIIVYKELRRLEIKICKEANLLPLSGIKFDNFHGMDIVQFSAWITNVSLWIAKHQMNIEYFEILGKIVPTLPLKEKEHANIRSGNACRSNWESICSKDIDDEIYVLGNPPYVGSRKQTEEQKEDLKLIYKDNYKNLDYVSAWFMKATNYLVGYNNIKCGFVSTNSICQGLQTSLVWDRVLLSRDLEFSFAHQSFIWRNNASNNAGIIVVIIGIRNKSSKPKYIINNNIRTLVSNISPYLVEGGNLTVQSRNSPLSNFPKINNGNMAADGGFLFFTKQEKNTFVNRNSHLEKYFKRAYGSVEYINDKIKWCLWLENVELDVINNNQELLNIINSVKDVRIKSSRPQLASKPHLFAQITQNTKYNFMIIPKVSSEARDYIPIGILDKDNISTDLSFIISNPPIYLLSVLISKMHMVWVKSIGGKMKTDYRYSKKICYNTFPFPLISDIRKEELIQNTFRILEEREKHSDRTLAQLYDPDKMPEGLKEAHHLNDLVVEKCYRSQPFRNDAERLEYLFTLYEKMIEEENTKGSLFEESTKKKRKRRVNA